MQRHNVHISKVNNAIAVQIARSNRLARRRSMMSYVEIAEVMNCKELGARVPFFGGSLFESCGKVKFPVMGVGSKTENDMAHLTIQCILADKAITGAVPGLSTPYEVENAARASYTRPLGQSAADKEWLMEITDRQWVWLNVEEVGAVRTNCPTKGKIGLYVAGEGGQFCVREVQIQKLVKSEISEK